jgi:hypothetical protein
MFTYRIRKTYLRIPDPDPIYERTPTYEIDLLGADGELIIRNWAGLSFSSELTAGAWVANDPNLQTLLIRKE